MHLTKGDEEDSAVESLTDTIETEHQDLAIIESIWTDHGQGAYTIILKKAISTLGESSLLAELSSCAFRNLFNVYLITRHRTTHATILSGSDSMESSCDKRG